MAKPMAGGKTGQDGGKVKGYGGVSLTESRDTVFL